MINIKNIAKYKFLFEIVISADGDMLTSLELEKSCLVLYCSILLILDIRV